MSRYSSEVGSYVADRIKRGQQHSSIHGRQERQRLPEEAGIEAEWSRSARSLLSWLGRSGYGSKRFARYDDDFIRIVAAKKLKCVFRYHRLLCERRLKFELDSEALRNLIVRGYGMSLQHLCF